MEVLMIFWIIFIVVSLAKAVNKSKKTTESSWSSVMEKKISRGTAGRPSLARQKVATGPAQVSWRNTAEVSKADITFRGLREGEDELAYLIRKNTAYEKLLETRLERRREN